MSKALSTFDFFEFQSFRTTALQEDKSFLDASEHRLVQSLRPRFPEIHPSTCGQAPYRCHLADAFLELTPYFSDLKNQSVVCQGVRQTLAVLFTDAASHGLTVALPSDVYPEYQRIAERVSCPVVCYEAQHGLPKQEILGEADVVLWCHPAKPWGDVETENQKSAIKDWLANHSSHRLWIDSVYQPLFSQGLREWYDLGQTVCMTSLSKGWIEPLVAGIAFVPPQDVKRLRPLFASLTKDERLVRKAFAALSDYSERPTDIQSVLLDLSQARSVQLKTSLPFYGYFAVSPHSAEWWLEQGVLTIPFSVFGGQGKGSIISSLQSLLISSES
ncbi:MAG: aminotransferase class I/II-fold pyridoxal phosphate-dependent enzyme [Gallionellaceae bacterium]